MDLKPKTTMEDSDLVFSIKYLFNILESDQKTYNCQYVDLTHSTCRCPRLVADSVAMTDLIHSIRQKSPSDWNLQDASDLARCAFCSTHAQIENGKLVFALIHLARQLLDKDLEKCKDLVS